MRLMLGRGNDPTLLVNVDNDYDPARFKFSVVNGCWEGEFINGNISIFGPPSGDWTSLDKVEVICYNQDRLRGEYGDVFYHFKNPNYVAPSKYREVRFDDLDDDIPF